MKTFTIPAIAIACTLLVSCGASKKAASTDYQYELWKQQQMQQQQQTAKLQEEAMSGSKVKVKEWKAEGYSLTGSMSTFTMYDLLERHNNLINSDPTRYVPVFGTGIGIELSEARDYALNNAAITYASAAGSVVSGGLARQYSNFGEQGMKLMGAYTQKVPEYILPLMRESLSVYKIENGKYNVQSYYVVDEIKAAEARSKAMDKALKETATEQIFGTSVDEWVKQFVAPDAQ